MEIIISNLRKYNEGIMADETVKLPVDDLKIEEILNKHTNNRQNDFIILEYDLPFEIGEYENLTKVNNLCKLISENNIEYAVIEHMEYDIEERLTKFSEEEILDYVAQVKSISADNKRNFCIEYFSEIGTNFKSIPDEMLVAIDWDKVYDQLEISLAITKDMKNKKFYYTEKY